MLIQEVALKEVKFYAFHGFYPEEQLIGTHFILDAAVTFEPKGDTEELLQTVNYEVINAILVKQMKHTQKLLETVVKNIVDELIMNYPFLDTIKVGIKKLHPPMLGEIGHSYVALTYTAEKN
jgi:dihydroneopterin aldolase